MKSAFEKMLIGSQREVEKYQVELLSVVVLELVINSNKSGEEPARRSRTFVCLKWGFCGSGKNDISRGLGRERMRS